MEAHFQPFVRQLPDVFEVIVQPRSHRERHGEYHVPGQVVVIIQFQVDAVEQREVDPHVELGSLFPLQFRIAELFVSHPRLSVVVPTESEQVA